MENTPPPQCYNETKKPNAYRVKTKDFQEDGRETFERGREMLVTFGKLSVNFRKLSGKT